MVDSAYSRAFSRTSTYIDENGKKITSQMIKKQKMKSKSKSGRRKSKFDFGPPDLQGHESNELVPENDFDWSEYGISNSPTKPPDISKLEVKKIFLDSIDSQI